MSDQLLNKILEKLESMENRILTMDNRISNIEGQLRENTDMIKAILHRTEELDAKYDALLNTTATRESVDRIEAKLDTLNTRQFNQEAEITLLKRAK
jgi:septation ring formation regulator EzrA